MPKPKKIKLKGVRPPKNQDPQAFFEALQELREFVRQFPGLGDEVMRDRKLRRQAEDRALAERNAVATTYHGFVNIPHVVPECYHEQNNLILLEPDVSEYFPDSNSVNVALRSLIVACSAIKKLVSPGTDT